MSRSIVKLIIVFSVFLLFSCKNDNSSFPLENHNFEFRIFEDPTKLENGFPMMFIEIRTKSIYECSNYSIRTEMKTNNSDIVELRLYDVIKPEVCQTSIGPARAIYPFPLKEGIHKLYIHMGENIEIFNLEIAKEYIQIKNINANRCVPITNKIYRYPQKSFVYAPNVSFENKKFSDDFLDSIKTKLTITEFTFPADGITPYNEIAGNLNNPIKPRYFLYQSENDFLKIESILKNFKQQIIKNKADILIRIRNWQNKYFDSSSI